MGYGGEKDLIEGEGLLGGTGQAKMAEVRWVEGAAEEGYAHGGHGDMVAGRNRLPGLRIETWGTRAGFDLGLVGFLLCDI